MIGLREAVPGESQTSRAELSWPMASRQRPPFRWSDIWKSPLHDFPIRDEIVYQYLPLSDEMSVLEIGPGSGFTAFRLARRVRQLTLMDMAPENIAQLQEALKDIPNVRLICADVCSPRLGDSLGIQFDAVFGLAVFDFLPDPQACLENLASLLRPGGYLLLQFPNYPPPKGPGCTCFRKGVELGELLDKAGFSSWAAYALRLRPLAQTIYQECYQRPLSVCRGWRNFGRGERPQSYDATWAFRKRKALEPYKYLLHAAWYALFAALRLGGNCFERRLLAEEILNQNVLLLARR